MLQTGVVTILITTLSMLLFIEYSVLLGIVAFFLLASLFAYGVARKQIAHEQEHQHEDRSFSLQSTSKMANEISHSEHKKEPEVESERDLAPHPLQEEGVQEQLQQSAIDELVERTYEEVEVDHPTADDQSFPNEEDSDDEEDDEKEWNMNPQERGRSLLLYDEQDLDESNQDEGDSEETLYPRMRSTTEEEDVSVFSESEDKSLLFEEDGLDRDEDDLINEYLQTEGEQKTSQESEETHNDTSENESHFQVNRRRQLFQQLEKGEGQS